MNGTPKNNVEERRKYVRAFNATMVKIWREQIALLGVIDTGGFYRSTVGISMTADGKFIDITLEQAFNTHGLFVDYGGATTRKTPATSAKPTVASASAGSLASILLP